MSRLLRMSSLAALLATATLLTYAPTFSAGFVDIDDADYVTENETVRAGLSADGFVWAFRDAHAGNWFPLTWLSHMSDVTLFGERPAAHHAMNVALHLVNVLLLFGMLTSISGALAPSFAVAALFALHPANVESVAWISQRKTTLSTLFGIVAIWSHVRHVRTGRQGARFTSLVSFTLSLLAKQTLVTLPLALLLLDWWPLRRSQGVTWRRLVIEKVPYLVLAAAAGVATLLAQGEAIATGASFPLAIRLGNVVLSYVRYLAHFSWPVQLAVFYPLYEDDVTLLRVIASAALLLALTAAAIVLRRRHPQILFGWLWFLLTLAPVVGVVQVGAQAMADRYVYVPYWGLNVAVVWSVWCALDRNPARGALRRLAALVLAVICVAYALLGHRQAEQWHDSIALFEDAVADTGRNYIAHRALAGQYFNRGQYALALQHAEEGARHPRDLGDVLPTWGMALYQTGAKAEAIAKLEEAIRVAPQNVLGYSNLGWIELAEGDPARASEVLAQAVRIDPRDGRSLQLLASSQIQMGQLAEAASTLEHLTGVESQNFDAWIERARTLGRLGRFADSTVVLQQALDAAVAFPDAARRPLLVAKLHQYRGDMLVAQGDGVGGAVAYQQALGSARVAGDASLVGALEQRVRSLRDAEASRPEPQSR